MHTMKKVIFAFLLACSVMLMVDWLTQLMPE